MAFFGKKKQDKTFKYPGVQQLMNGNAAIIKCERNASDAASAFVSSSIPELMTHWHQEKEKGYLNISNRPIKSIHAADNHAAATIAAGLSLSGLRASLFSSSAQSVASMHESLFASSGKRLPYVFNICCKAASKASVNIHSSHDDYHSIDDSGFIQFFARNNQSVADLTIISRKIAELSLNPVAIAQDGFLTSHLIEPLYVPERELIESFLGLPDDMIDTPTPAQAILFGKSRRRVPETWSVDQPVQTGGIQNSDSYMQTVAGQRPYFFDHVAEIAEHCLQEWFELTGRHYQRINQFQCDDADYLIVAQGSILSTAEATAAYLCNNRKLKVGVVDLTMFRPFPGDLISHLLKGRKGILVLERTDQPLAEDLPIIAEIRSSISKAIDNGNTNSKGFNHYASYAKTSDVPPLYSACFGLGGHELQPKDIIAAVDNMLPEGQQHKFVYLGIDFVDTHNLAPQQQIQQEALFDAYPAINELSLKGSDNPELLPDNSSVIRIHSIAGGEIACAGENLAHTLFEQFGFEIKANPEYGAEKKGQPTTFYITAATEAIRLNNAYSSVNTVISTDPTFFSHCDSLTEIADGGVLIIQNSLNDAKAVWNTFPAYAQKIIVDKHIKVFFVDSIKVVQEHLQQPEITESRSETELQHLVFKSVFFKVTHLLDSSEKTAEDIQSLVDNNQGLVKASYHSVQEIVSSEMVVDDVITQPAHEPAAPLLLQRKSANEQTMASIHRFWNQTGHLYHGDNHANNLADPFASSGIVPAASGIFGDMTAARSQHPQWIAENCNACGLCTSSCPDSAIPGLINTVNEVFETNIKRIEKSGHTVKHLRRAIRTVEKKYHELTADKSEGTTLDPIFAKAIGDTIKEYAEPEREEVAEEFEWFKDTIGSFKFALTQTYHDEMNNRMPRSGGLFSITINPNSCKGCMECISVCEPEALKVVEQTDESIDTLRNHWHYWLDLPTSNKKYSRIDDLQAKKGVLDTLLLDKKNHDTLFSSDNTRAGSGEKIAIHLFTSTLTALMQPRIDQHIKQINQLITDMEKRIHLQLAETLDIGDIDAIETAIDENQDMDLTLSRLTGSIDKNKATKPIDPNWLKWALQLVAKLKDLKWRYTQGTSGEGRANLGMAQGNNEASAWNANFPYNPYPFPWTSHLSTDAPSLAMGLFEGHMVKMAEGFKTIRMAELEIKGKYDKAEHDSFFAYFDWHQFSEEEYLLCPPLVSLTAEGTGVDSGLQSLSHSLTSGIPIKVLLLDNQLSQNSDRLRKEPALLTMAHRTSYVHQGSISNTSHLLEGYIDGLNYRGPALWSIYASNQPEKGLANNSLRFQSKIAVESRAYPLINFAQKNGTTWENSINLTGNPDIDQDWVTYSLDYTDEYGNQFSKDVPLTYADWALTEAQYAAHFKTVAADSEADEMMLLAEFIEKDADTQARLIPFIWAVHPQTNHLLKAIVSQAMVKATVECKDFWHTLKGLGGLNRVEVDTQAIADQAKAEMAQSITEGLMSMMGGDASALTQILTEVPAGSVKTVPPVEKKTITANAATDKKPAVKPETEKQKKPEPEKPAAKGKTPHEPVWIETPDCTTCDECVDIAPAMFQYDADKKAIVVDPTAGTFEEIVRSAEKCTAVIIHPGTPWNPDEPNLDQLIKRAEKFQ